MRTDQMLVHTLKSDDAPYAPHVWHGTAGMGNTDEYMSVALCNGYLVVRRGQKNEDVRDALSIMPDVLAVTKRIPWGDPKHMHLIHEDAVVLMVRSARDVDDDDGRDAASKISSEATAKREPGSGQHEHRGKPENAKHEDTKQEYRASPCDDRDTVSALDSQKHMLGMLKNLRDKQRIGLVRYHHPSAPDIKLAALCIPPSPHAYEQLGVPWRFRDMAGHDTVLVVVGEPKRSSGSGR
jgi:hypothetical protein